MTGACNIVGCKTSHNKLRKGMCNRHYLRWYKNGDPNVLKGLRHGKDNHMWSGDAATYNTKHLRVKYNRGKAEGPCSRCFCTETNFRFEWAQIHGTTGSDPSHYTSLCRPCHEIYDAKFTEEQIEEIRASYFMGISQQNIADEYGTTQPHISLICSMKRLNNSTLLCEGMGSL